MTRARNQADVLRSPDGARRRRRGARASRPSANPRRRPLHWIGVGVVVGALAIAIRLLMIEEHPALDSTAVRTPAPAAQPPGPPPAAPAAAVGPLDPARYLPEGCLALGPIAGDKGRTVFLDAGHGGVDPGAPGLDPAVQEKDLTLAIAQDAAGELRSRGYRVVLSRADDSLGSRTAPEDLVSGGLNESGQRSQLTARARCANLSGAQALVSIHLNSFDQADVRGAETLFEPDRPFGDNNRRLANLLQRDILRGFAELGRPVPDRGVRGDTTSGNGRNDVDAHDLVILGPQLPGRIDEPSAMPGALIEPLFLTNPEDAALATSPEGRQVLARAIRTALEEFLDRS